MAPNARDTGSSLGSFQDALERANSSDSESLFPYSGSEAPRNRGTSTLSTQLSIALSETGSDQVTSPGSESASLLFLDGALSWGALETLCLHQAICRNPIHPHDDADRLGRLGTWGFIHQLIVDCEGSLGLPSGYGIPHEDRLENIRRYCTLNDPPGQPVTTTPYSDIRTLVCELQRYESLRTNDFQWPADKFGEYAWIFAARGIGGLRYNFPAYTIYLERILRLLLSASESRRLQYGVGNFTPTISFDLFTPGLADMCAVGHTLGPATTRPVVVPDYRIVSTCGGKLFTGLLYALNHVKYEQEPDFHNMTDEWLGQYLATKGLYPTTEYHGQLRDYRELVQMFSQFQVPDDVTVLDLVTSLQHFPKARTDFTEWHGAHWADLVTIYSIKCLAILGFSGSVRAMEEDPRRVLFYTYLGFLSRTKPKESSQKALHSETSVNEGTHASTIICNSKNASPDRNSWRGRLLSSASWLPASILDCIAPGRP